MSSDTAGTGPDAQSGPFRGRGILEVPGIRLGHAGELTDARLTGITTVLPPSGSTIGVDVRGGGPATRETDVIAPGTHSSGADAIVLTGGSAFGLGAVSGVVDTLAVAGLGFPAPGLVGAVIPLVPAAAIYDLGRGDGSVAPPRPDEGAQATHAALSGRTEQNVDGPIKNHILFDWNFTSRWFNRFIKDHNIIEIPVSCKGELTKNDMILYHISDGKVVTFKRGNNNPVESEKGMIGYLKDAYLHQNI